MVYHNAGGGQRQICRRFAEGKVCSYGEKCKFLHIRSQDTSHVRSLGSNSRETIKSDARKTHSRANGPQEKQLRQWRFLTTAKSKPDESLSKHTRNKFFQDALDLLSLDAGIMQAVVQSLASEGGIQRILQVVKKDYQSRPTESQRAAVAAPLLPLFKIISHPKVLSSGILEMARGTIYNSIYGPGGRFALQLFGFIGGVAHTFSADDLEPTMAAFAKMLDLNGTAELNDEFKRIAVQLSTAVESVNDDRGDLTVINTRKWLERAKSRLGIDKPAIKLVHEKKKSAQPPVNFQFTRNGPGRLSVTGVRHDNDSENIQEILPTFEESMCNQSPYLPALDPSQLHLPGTKGLIDRHFRLYREDVVGPTRDAIKFEVNRHKNPGARWTGLRTNFYSNLAFEHLRCDTNQGLVAIISIDQPKDVTNMGIKQREEWWGVRKRLQKDSLVCIVDQQRGHAIFCTVAEIKEQSGRRKEADEEHLAEGEQIVYSDFGSDACRAFLTVAPAEERDVAKIVDYFTHQGSSWKLTLLEFPKVLLRAFRPTLSALQAMVTEENLPFSEFLASQAASEEADVGPPTYAQQRNFEFDLSFLLPKRQRLSLSPRREFDVNTLIKKSALDKKQAEALVHALTRRLALCQGPPGTGKSYIGVALTRVLLANKKAADLGPILVVCYTNHALDQILERFIDSGIKQLVRVGGQSKSERLENLNLRVVSQGIGRTRMENDIFFDRLRTLKADASYANEIIGGLSHADAADNLKSYLLSTYPVHHNQFWGIDEEGFQVYALSSEYIIRTWLHGNTMLLEPARTVEELLKAKTNVWQMSRIERHAVHAFWIKDFQQSCRQRLLSAMDDYQDTKDAHTDAKYESSLRCLAEADIIGITTSGLAGKLNLLQRLPIKVLLVEEAAEVLEAHTLTALLPSVEHAILIGDHFQLKPSVSNYGLSSESYSGKQYSLDVSLFERLVSPPKGIPGNVSVPFSILETQRRMHPSISALIRSTLYPALEDSPKVQKYPAVTGMNDRLYWLDHCWLEVGAETDELLATSKSNDFEVEMTACLVAHILSQGEYRSGEIAVLTPYLGQLFKLRERLSKQFEFALNDHDVVEMEKTGIIQNERLSGAPATPVQKASLLQSLRVASVDNFQGEEAKIVIVSLVRSNTENNCGFLKTNNRINVLLSRAMHGLYLIGNSTTSAGVPMWAKVIEILRKSNRLGKSLTLCCPRHSKTLIRVSTPEDFQRFSPEGGCDLRCDKRLKCGHMCLTKCHSDLRHDNVRCLEPCSRPKPGCDHVCKKYCGDKCDSKCLEILKDVNIELACGHIIKSLPCWKFQSQDRIQCMVTVEKTVPVCQHKVRVKCQEDVTAETFPCQEKCSGDLKCGHACGLSCSFCRKNFGDKHGKCGQICRRPLSNCSHSCMETCHPNQPCGVCKRPCEVSCSHSRCDRQCGVPCVPCAEELCSSSCPHSQCTMPCAAPCDWIPCSVRCTKYLDCGHQCPSLCGEGCPDQKYCQQCAKEPIKSMLVDFLEMKTLSEVNLDKDPLIVPRCGHAALMSSMDGSLEMSSVYEINPDGTVKCIKTSEPFPSKGLKDLPGCPTCRGDLRGINRYGRLVRRVLLDESTKRFVTSAGVAFGNLNEQLFAAQEKLRETQVTPKGLDLPCALIIQDERDAQFQVIVTITEKWVRYDGLKIARKSIADYFAKVHQDQTPFSRLYNLVEVARRRVGRPNAIEFRSPVSQVTFHIMALAMLIRCDMFLLADVLNEFGKFRKSPLGMKFQVSLKENRNDCAWLIEEALKTKDYERAVEGHIFYARYCAIERPFTSSPEVSDGFKTEGEMHIAAAEGLCNQHGGKLKSLANEINDAWRSLTGGSFVQIVSSEERRSILAAMAKEFRGTGHWYTCANGHPFTVGECGRPMQLARCPQCDAPIGGQDHRPTSGVTQAKDLERELAQTHLG